MKKILLIALFSISVNCFAEDLTRDFAFSSCQNEYRNKSNEYEIGGRFSYQVSNPLPISQGFNVLYKICDDRNVCNSWTKIIYVQPNHIHGTREVIVKVTPSYHSTGSYPFKVTTNITNSKGSSVLYSIQQCNLIIVPDNSLTDEYESNM